MSGQDITIYEASERLGGAFSLAGSAVTGYILPTGSVFDAEFRCTFELLALIRSVSDPARSVKDDFFAFNERYPFRDRAFWTLTATPKLWALALAETAASASPNAL